MKTNNLFLLDRLAYSKYGQIYAMGTFINRNDAILHSGDVLLLPKESTVTMFDYLRANFEYPLFSDTYLSNKEERELYITNTASIGHLLSNYLGKKIKILGEGAEFLDGVGHLEAHHTIRCLESIDEDGKMHYIVIGGRAPLEIKSDELSNAESFSYNNDIFKIHENGKDIIYSELAFADFSLALIQDYFEKKLTEDDIEKRTQFFWLNTPFLTESHSLNILSKSTDLEKDRYCMIFSLKATTNNITLDEIY